MHRILAIQALIVAVTTAVVWLVWGQAAGQSAALGGLSCAVPAAVYVLLVYGERLALGRNRTLTPFISELAKILLTAAFLWAAAQKPDLNWAAMLAGFVLALKSYLLALVLRI